jgi:hypothetical protein
MEFGRVQVSGAGRIIDVLPASIKIVPYGARFISDVSYVSFPHKRLVFLLQAGRKQAGH